jgi:tetratricopeptide (TPR) repeat protein
MEPVSRARFGSVISSLVRSLAVLGLAVAACPGLAVAFQAAPLSGAQLIGQGRFEEALAEFRRDIQLLPKSVAANNGAGVALDLMGRYAEAQPYFTQAIKLAAKPLDKALAQRSMAIAHGFAGDCKGAEKYESDAYDFYLNTSDFYNAGEVADELGRLCIDAGDLNRSYQWYEKGHDTGLQEPKLGDDRKDLWNFRWAHARARIAVRRGKTDEARKLVTEAKAILDKGRNPDQESYFPYLAGYVEFYAGDYQAALTLLNNATATDPFIRCLLAQTYEKLGNNAQALEYYRKAAATTAHSVPAAYAQPLARKKLEALQGHL